MDHPLGRLRAEARDQPFQIGGTTGVDDGPLGPPGLDPVAPNPTRGPGRFGVTLPSAGRIRLTVMDVAGREVAVLADGPEPAGRREVSWDGRVGRGRADAGLYFVRLESAGQVQTRKFAVAH